MPDLADLSIRDLSSLQDLRVDQIVIQPADEFRSSFRQSSGRSGLHFFSELSDDAMMPFFLQIREFLGTLEYEQARVVLLRLGDVFCYSISATSTWCPICPLELHLSHLFNCPNSPFRNVLPSWVDFLQSFQQGKCLSFVSICCLCAL